MHYSFYSNPNPLQNRTDSILWGINLFKQYMMRMRKLSNFSAIHPRNNSDSFQESRLKILPVCCLVTDKCARVVSGVSRSGMEDEYR